jgi:hypothetical protein
MHLNRKLVVISLLLAGTVWGERWLLTEREKTAETPADLGPEKIDVSNYPAIQQANYRIFLHKCSPCHSPARAINSSYITAKEWKKYIGWMHNLSHKSWLWGEDRQWIQDFLVYDAQLRKVQNRDAFTEEQRALRAYFEQTVKRRGGNDEEERRENP